MPTDSLKARDLGRGLHRLFWTAQCSTPPALSKHPGRDVAAYDEEPCAYTHTHLGTVFVISFNNFIYHMTRSAWDQFNLFAII